MNKLSRALTQSAGGTFASDNDPQLVADALPFALKTFESLLESRPNDKNLLTATARAYALYAIAFVQMPADTLSDEAAQTREYERAKLLLKRSRDYGLRALAVQHPGIDTVILRGGTDSAAARLNQSDTTALYWTAAAWAAELTIGKPGLKTLFMLPRATALMNRLYELNPGFGCGVVHDFFISFYAVAPKSLGGDITKAQIHYDSSVALCGGVRAAPHVTWAARVCVKRKDAQGFRAALTQALAIDVSAPTPERLSNIIYQAQARWLLSRENTLFAAE